MGDSPYFVPQGDDLLGAAAASGSIDSSLDTTSSQLCPCEIDEHTELSADVWNEYFREYPDDFIIDSFDESPKKGDSPQYSSRGSPLHRPHGSYTVCLVLSLYLVLLGSRVEVRKASDTLINAEILLRVRSCVLTNLCFEDFSKPALMRCSNVYCFIIIPKFQGCVHINVRDHQLHI